MSLTLLLLFALITALATGVGVIPFAMFPPVSPERKGVSTAIASGLMGAASLTLIKEGIPYGMVGLAIGLVAGGAFVWGSDRFLSGRELLVLEGFAAADTKKMLLMVGVMTVHSITEGVGIGVAFGDGMELGLFITIAIAIHNIPEGLAIGLVLIPRGVSILKTAWWAVFSSLPQVVLAVPAYLAVEFFRPSLPIGLGFAAGAMIWMVATELLPDALKHTSVNKVTITTLISGIAMYLFQFLI
ncbi:ZIP family metal transporter [Bacteroidota bacterium]